MSTMVPMTPSMPAAQPDGGGGAGGGSASPAVPGGVRDGPLDESTFCSIEFASSQPSSGAAAAQGRGSCGSAFGFM